jgi:putative CocE/NonD family hydrolase
MEVNMKKIGYPLIFLILIVIIYGLSISAGDPANNANNSTNNSTVLNQSFNNTTNYTVKTLLDVQIPMRDGKNLSANIWMPETEGKYPVILLRTPYDKNDPVWNYTGYGNYFASNGYVFIAQDVRGKGDSEGDFNFLFQEGNDGYDSIEWAAQQPWSDGKVGMMGFSYMGTVQWLAAREKPPHLVCIAPTAATGRYMEEIPSVGGVFYMGWALPWTLQNNGRSMNLEAAKLNWTQIYQHRPLITADEETGTTVKLYREFLEHPTMDDYWKRLQFTQEDFTKFGLPTLSTCGWYDSDQPGTIYYWNGLNKGFSNQSGQYLHIGPWIHSGTFSGGNGTVGDLTFPNSVSDVKAVHLEFFDSYLKNMTNKTNMSRATVYLTGLNSWINLTSYPPTEMNITPLYLNSKGQANTDQGDGFLEWNFTINTTTNNTTSNFTAGKDNYTYDPANPRPVPIGSYSMDVSDTENRSDVLVYTTEPLDEPVIILGPVATEFYASSDARDTDFTARLIDVQPDGRAITLGTEEFGGAIRARYRQGFDKEVLLEPGKIEKYRIELFDIGHVFQPGHRIRLEISSSAYPILQPNPNTGNPIATDTEQQIAHQIIYHDAEHQSIILLPIIPVNSTIYNQLYA